MKKRLTVLERASVAITTAFALTAGFMPVIIRASNTPTVVPAATGSTEALADATIMLPTAATTLSMRVTAYSSSIDETDDSPFYTANGTHVRDGIVATNLLPLGTKIMIPSLFGKKIFTVEDRMAKHFKNTIDIWMSSKRAALRFGVGYTSILVLGTTTADLAISKR